MIITSLIAAADVPTEFYRYLRARDRAFHYEVAAPVRGSQQFNLTSQKWQGTTWKHTVLYRQPESLAAKNVAILFITGDGPREGDFSMLQLVTQSTGMPTAMLFDIPNQPLWGHKEDDLIAHTVEQYWKTKDPTWPLLFPMAKSAIRAMDMIQRVTAKSSNPIKGFIVAGASKRGWTTWFVGASGDRRVLGIAPMVYDNLNVRPQMKHQLDLWGAYSEQIKDYSERGILQKLDTPDGQKISQMIDPYSYRSRVKVPTLIVNGANDPFWTTDALSIYWNDLKQPHWASIVPNAGHGLGNGFQAVAAVGAFARAIANHTPMPQPTASIEGLKSDTAGLGEQRVIRATMSFGGVPASSVVIWTVTNKNADFRDSKWSSQVSVDGAPATVNFLVPKNQPSAVMVEFRYKVGGRAFSLSSPVKVFRP